MTARTRNTKTNAPAPARVVPLVDFVSLLTPKFSRPYHLAPLIALLERAAREPVRAVVSTPPRHAKTETVKHGIVRALLENPALKVIYASYAARLSEKKSRDMRTLAKRAGVPLAPDAKSRADWRTGVDDGGVWATSVGGAVTGEGGDLIIVDDPVRGRAFAESQLERDKLAEWFDSDLLTRLEPNGSVVVVMTRWHADDLAQRLIDRGYEHVNLPAIANGRSLWPERWSIGELMLTREAIGEHFWRGLYMGQPPIRGGALFDDVRFYDELPAVPLTFRIGIDLAYSTKTSSDYSCAVVLASTPETQRGAPGVHFVVDVRRVQATVPAFRATLDELQGMYPTARLMSYVSGTEKGTVQMLQESGIRIESIPALVDKFTRAQPLSAAWNAGRVLVPREAPWLDAFIGELCSFTGIGDRHDDQVDAIVSAFYSAAVKDIGWANIHALNRYLSGDGELTPSQLGAREMLRRTGQRTLTDNEMHAFGLDERPRSRPAGDAVFRGQGFDVFNRRGKAAY